MTSSKIPSRGTPNPNAAPDTPLPVDRAPGRMLREPEDRWQCRRCFGYQDAAELEENPFVGEIHWVWVGDRRSPSDRRGRIQCGPVERVTVDLEEQWVEFATGTEPG